MEKRTHQASFGAVITQPITLLLPDDLVSIARAEADRSARPLEIVLLDWIKRGGQEDLQSLSDEDLLAICSDLMDHYQAGLLRKARAWKEAVARGLRTLSEAI